MNGITRTPIEVNTPTKRIRNRLVVSALGLTAQEATAYKQIFARMVYDKKPRYQLQGSDVKVVNEQKAQIINKTGA